MESLLLKIKNATIYDLRSIRNSVMASNGNVQDKTKALAAIDDRLRAKVPTSAIVETAAFDLD